MILLSLMDDLSPKERALQKALSLKQSLSKVDILHILNNVKILTSIVSVLFHLFVYEEEERSSPPPAPMLIQDEYNASFMRNFEAGTNYILYAATACTRLRVNEEIKLTFVISSP